MRKILFPISEKEYIVCQKRLCHLIKTIAQAFWVDVVTTAEEVFDDLKTKLEGCQNTEVRYLKEKFLPLTFDFRDNVSKIFVKYTEDLYIPGTDLKMWKTAAFDDLWGHISACAFPEVKSVDADAVLLPLQSWEELPLESTDVLNTALTLVCDAFELQHAAYPKAQPDQCKRPSPRDAGLHFPGNPLPVLATLTWCHS